MRSGPPSLAFGKKVFEQYERPQTMISLVYPGVGKESPDFYAATLIAEILGGEGIDSRLFTELREKRGLTYGAYAGLYPNMDWGVLTVDTSTKGDTTGDALELAHSVVRSFAENGPTQEEFEGAKRFRVGAYAMRNLSSTTGIALTLKGLQQHGRPRDFPQRLEEIYDAVTLDEVKALARRLLSVEPTVLIVGPNDG